MNTTVVQRWQVSSTGRSAHLVTTDGASVCGLVNVATRWRAPADQPRCEACSVRAPVGLVLTEVAESVTRHPAGNRRTET